ncbi:MAG TPA: Ku protein [Casimicrobiaceae bacterium]|nr:Ku protein [Casimicrobiaceae bacterium]
MPRALWKGAIAFGLVNIPVELYPGARSDTLDLDWIDKRNMAPVGYQRINKTTGKVVPKEQIVKGYQYQKGHYVLLSDEDFRQANPKATQTVDIVAFVEAGSIAPPFFETPYRLAPAERGAKAYALLREALREAGKVGIAYVVIRQKQHLAALMVWGDMLLLEILRWNEEILRPDELDLPSTKDVRTSDKELQLARRLIDDLSDKWDPEKYKDTYRADLMAQIQRKVKAGKTEELTEPVRERAEGGAQVIDLMQALKQSLEAGGSARKRPAKAAPVERAAKKASRTRKRA